MDKKKHIVFVTPGFPQSNDTWVTTYFANYVKALKKYTTYNISIVALHYPFKASSYLYHGCRVIAIGGANKKNFRKAALLIKAFHLIKQLHKESRIDILHCLWLNDASLLGYGLSKILKTKLIITAMGTELNGRNIYVKLINFNNIKLVAVSSKMLPIINEKLGVTPTVIPWGIEKGPYDQEQERTIDFLFVGFLNAIKNLDLFLEILYSLKQLNHNFNATIVGEEYPGTNYIKIIESYGLENNITFIGRLGNRDVLKLMEKSKILVHTSSFESQGYVFLEALSKGMTIVSFDVGIARASEKWFIVKSKEEFICVLNKLLVEKLDFVPKYNYLIKETISAYVRLYEG